MVDGADHTDLRPEAATPHRLAVSYRPTSHPRLAFFPFAPRSNRHVCESLLLKSGVPRETLHAAAAKDGPGYLSSMLPQDRLNHAYTVAMSFERAMYYGAPSMEEYSRGDTVPHRMAALRPWRHMLDGYAKMMGAPDAAQQQQQQPKPAVAIGSGGGGAFRPVAATAGGGGGGGAEGRSELAGMLAKLLAPELAKLHARSGGSGTTPTPGEGPAGGGAPAPAAAQPAAHRPSTLGAGGDGGGAPAPPVQRGGDAQLRQQQCQRLLQLSHAYRCRDSHRDNCSEPQCVYFQFLWGHIEKCISNSCDVKHCVSSRYCIEHYRGCKDRSCDICVPVRLSAESGMKRPVSNGDGASGSLAKRARLEPGAAGAGPGSGVPLISPAQLEQLGPKLGYTTEAWAGMDAKDKLLIYQRRAAEAQAQRAAAAGGGGGGGASTGGQRKGKVDGDCSLANTFNDVQIIRLMTSLRDDFNAGVAPGEIRMRVTLILSQLMDHQWGWIFSTPVDPVKLNLPDYYEIVKKPMDLGTVRRRLDANGYRTLKAFVSDVRLVWSNAMAYNPPGSDVHGIAMKMQRWFEQMIAQVETEYGNRHRRACLVDGNCSLCGGGVFELEPPTLYCNQCSKRIKKDQPYFSTTSNRYHLCPGCHGSARKTGLDLFFDGQHIQIAALVRKKNDFKASEPWVRCDNCKRWQHFACSLFNGKRTEGTDIPHYCPQCVLGHITARGNNRPISSPVRGAKALPTSRLSDLIEERLRTLLEARRAVLAAEQEVDPSAVDMPDLTVRMVACADKTLLVQPDFYERYRGLGYPSQFNYRSKALVLWQRLGGVDVFIYGVYVQVSTACSSRWGRHWWRRTPRLTREPF